jgi:hypothetical protein
MIRKLLEEILRGRMELVWKVINRMDLKKQIVQLVNELSCLR